MKTESKQRWHQRRGELPIYYTGLDELGDVSMASRTLSLPTCWPLTRLVPAFHARARALTKRSVPHESAFGDQREGRVTEAGEVGEC
jgi:hypothetical protein